MDDYFNHGFNERSFKHYQKKVLHNEAEYLNDMLKDQDFLTNVFDDQNAKYHKTLNFYLPHELGGCGAPYQERDKYNLFNIYTEADDLAIIRPRWTEKENKEEFKVELK